MSSETKSDLIRSIASQYGSEHSAKWFVEKCRKFGVEVFPQQVWAVLGLMSERNIQDSPVVKTAAKKLVALCHGDQLMAIRSIKIHG